MTRSFPCSRLAEIAQAEPIEPVSFPTHAEVAQMRRMLKRMRDLLVVQGLGGDEPTPKPHHRSRTR